MTSFVASARGICFATRRRTARAIPRFALPAATTIGVEHWARLSRATRMRMIAREPRLRD